VAYVFLLWKTSYAVGLPDLARTTRSAVGATAASLGVSALGVSASQLVLGSALLPRFVVLGSVLLLFPVLVIAATISQRGRDGAARRERIVFVGGRTEAELLAEDFHGHLVRPATLTAALGVEEARGRPGDAPLLVAVNRHDASLVVLDVAAQADDSIVAQAADAHARGVRIRTLSMFYEEWLGKLPVSELERVSLLFDVGELHRARYARAKRVFDVVAGALGLMVLVVAVPLVAIGNLVGNRGPLLFRQERVGRWGRTFTILKFRTMVPGSGSGEWTARDDPRVTGFGRLLRRTHLDELPQVINTLRGDLSLIGPRPEQPRYVAELSEKLPFYDVRHLVRPGLTGWAQVMYGYAGDEQDALEKLQYEFFYLRRQGLALDFRIVGRTLRSLVHQGGR